MALAAGRVVPAGTSEEVINIDEDVAVASFAVYDPTRSLRVSVRGATGNVIELDPAETGLITVDDPAALVHLGYGFEHPRPGPWRVTLHATASTPATGADYAVTAQVHGGAALHATTSELVPAVGQQVRVDAVLERDGAAVPVQRALTLIRDPDGAVREVPLAGDGDLTGIWRPRRAGLHSIDVVVFGQSADGAPVTRVAFLVADVQPESGLAAWLARAGGAALLALALLAVAGLVVALRLHRRSRRNST